MRSCLIIINQNNLNKFIYCKMTKVNNNSEAHTSSLLFVIAVNAELLNGLHAIILIPIIPYLPTGLGLWI